MKDTLELVKIETLTGIDVYRDPASLDAIIEGIRATVSAMTFDVSTEAGRDLIRSTAHKITRSKTALDKLGKDLTEVWRKQTTEVNKERNRATVALETLAETVRAPLTEYEDREKTRVAQHEYELAKLNSIIYEIGISGIDSTALGQLLIDYADSPKREWEEFADRYKAKDSAIKQAFISRIKTVREEEESAAKAEADRIESLRVAEIERQRLQNEREAAIALQAAEHARLAAERAAEAEAARIAEQVKAEKLKAEQAAAKAKAAAEAEAQKLEREKQAALAEIELHKHKAANLERERLFYQKQAEEKAKQILEDQIKADAAREADRANRERVKQEIVEDLCGRVQSAIDIALAIMAGKIRNVKVVY